MYPKRSRLEPEHLLKAGLLMAPRCASGSSVKGWNDLLFKWLDLNINHSFDPRCSPIVGRRRGPGVSAADSGQAREQRLLSEDHFSEDHFSVEGRGSLGIAAECGTKTHRRVQPWGTAAAVAISGPERRRNETHRSTTDPEARLATGKEARLCPLLMDSGMTGGGCASHSS